MDIRFCDQCDASIPESDVDQGAATRLDGRLLCSICLPRAKRQRIIGILVQPLALLAAAALGAAGAVLLLSPKIDTLSTELLAQKNSSADRPAVSPAVVQSLENLGDMSLRLAEAQKTFEAAVEQRDGEVTAALADNAEKLTALAGEIREIRVFLAEAAKPPAASPPTNPEVAPAEPEAAPEVDLATWLPLAADPDSGVRLSALVALEPSRDPRVLTAARQALSDGDAVVRAQAAKMVADRGDQESVATLIDLLMDRNSRVRAVAHRSLETLTGLELDFDTTDAEDTRRGAVEAIRKLLGG
jgi:HEAT repeat protein